MRLENVPCLPVLIAAGALSLTACSDSSEDPGGPVVPISDQRQGVAIRFQTNGTGSCSFDASPEDLNVAALNPDDFNQSAMCGACMEVEGASGKVRVRVVDVCERCAPDQFAMTQQAFESMASADSPQMSVKWRYVSCPVVGPLRYRIKEGSNPFWVAIQLRNHRLPVYKLEWQKEGTWVPLQRLSYNYFVEPMGMGEGPVKLRVTALDGQVLEDTLPVIAEGLLVDGASQFEAD